MPAPIVLGVLVSQIILIKNSGLYRNRLIEDLFETYKNPMRNTLWRAIFFFAGKFSLQIRGTGMAMMIKSEIISVIANTVRTSRLLMHFVRKMPIGAQFNDQWVPHWKTVVKKKASVHATVNPIITQHMILKPWEAPNSRFQRKRNDILIRPKTNFSVV
jgi:hypothetical protein